MNREEEKALRQRAVELENCAEPGVIHELVELLKCPSAQVRRLSASALGKLATIADPSIAVPALTSNLHDPHPQARQYTIRTISTYGASAQSALIDLEEIAQNATEKDYNKRDAAKAITTINEAIAIKEKVTPHYCQRCNIPICAHEYTQSIQAFQRE